MSDTQSLMALFQESTQTAEAIDALHTLGIPDDQMTVITGVPYPEGALGRHAEWLRLPQIVAAGALSGFVFGVFLAVITPHLYRLDVGGHPTVSFAPAAVIVFVFTMLATIISTFLGVLWEMNFPEFGRKYYDRLVTDGYLSILIEFSPRLEDQVRQILGTHQAHKVYRPERQPL
jgi:hypothetical protein